MIICIGESLIDFVPASEPEQTARMIGTARCGLSSVRAADVSDACSCAVDRITDNLQREIAVTALRTPQRLA